jgi:hypothetical protein
VINEHLENMMNFDVDVEKLISLETIIAVEDLIDAHVRDERLVIRADQISDLRDDILQAIRVELRKYTNS